jgi:hypothetical protein
MISTYQGNGAYCYANSASMLIREAAGEHFSPSYMEVLTGFALGASLERNDMLFFDNCTSSPDRALGNAFELLGFQVTEQVYGDNDPVPIDELGALLGKGPVLLGPLDMGHLTYNPNYRHLGGSDHYVLALEMNENEVLVHDPAGFPYAWLPLERLEPAWRADGIAWSSGTFRYWAGPKRIAHPTEEQIYERALRLFKSVYEAQRKAARSGDRLFGADAITAKAEHIRAGQVRPEEKGHFVYFAFPLGARRANDFACFFKGRDGLLARLKEKQARLLGQCQSFAVLENWKEVYAALGWLADVEQEFEAAVLSRI